MMPLHLPLVCFVHRILGGVVCFTMTISIVPYDAHRFRGTLQMEQMHGH